MDPSPWTTPVDPVPVPGPFDHFSHFVFLRRLNAELEERTASLIKEAEEVMVQLLKHINMLHVLKCKVKSA